MHELAGPELRVLLAPFAVRTAPINEVQPDVLVARYDDLTEACLSVAPVLAAKTLSRSTQLNDRNTKEVHYESQAPGRPPPSSTTPHRMSPLRPAATPLDVVVILVTSEVLEQDGGEDDELPSKFLIFTCSGLGPNEDKAREAGVEIEGILRSVIDSVCDLEHIERALREAEPTSVRACRARNACSVLSVRPTVWSLGQATPGMR